MVGDHFEINFMLYAEVLIVLTEDDRAAYDRDIMWLKANQRNPATEKEIFERMKRTSRLRRSYIAGCDGGCPTATEILDMFPRFLDTDGQVSIYIFVY
jgi:hypothetical protein